MGTPTNPLHALVRCGRVGLGVAALLSICVLAAGCGGGSPRPSVASLGTSAQTTATEPSTSPRGSKPNPTLGALAFIACMRTHGEPNMPEPSFSKNGRSASIDINAGSGIDPNSPRFLGATKACEHLLPNKGVPSAGQTITPADQADYLKGAACMRSHGIADFPDPSFRDNGVSFTTTVPINANSPQYEKALAICQKLIPAGLPYSSSSNP